MAGIGSITFDAAGAVSAPASLDIRLPTVESQRHGSHALLSMVSLPGLRGVMWADGIHPVRHLVEGDVVRTGGLPSQSAMSASPSGTAASSTLTLTANLSDADQIFLGKNKNTVKFVDTLDTSSDGSGGIQVHLGTGGSAASDTLDNLKALVNATGVQGVDYFDAILATAGSTAFGENDDITATDKTATTLKFEADTIGAVGNAYWSEESVDGGGVYSFNNDPNFAGGADGSGSSPDAGVFSYGFTSYRDLDEAETGISPLTTATSGAAQEIDLSSMTANSDTSFDFTRWYRTTAQGGILRLGDTIARAGTTDTDDVSDTELTAFGEIQYDESAFRDYEEGHVPRFRFLARYQGRIFGFGAIRMADYAIGDATLANGASTVDFSSDDALPVEEWEGKLFKFDDDPRGYRIVSVDESNETITLSESYEGASRTDDAYKIIDDRNPETLYWTPVLKPNQWPSANSLNAISSPDPEGLVGGIVHQDALIVFTRTGIWEVTPSAVTTFQARPRYEGVGCVSGHSIVSVDGYLYWAAHDGIYQWDGRSAAPLKISSPPVGQGRISGIQGTYFRLNRAHAHRITAHYDPERRVIRWYVPLDNNVAARDVLVLDLQTFAWSLDTTQGEVLAASVTDASGALQTITGDVHGILRHIDLSNSDGCYDVEPMQSLTSATTTTLTVSSAPWTASDLIGCPVWIKAASDGSLQRATITANTTSELTLDYYITAPSASDQIMVGGIGMDVQSGRFDLGDPGRRHIIAALRILFAVDSDGQLFVAWASDQDDPTVHSSDHDVDLTKSDGEERIRAQKLGRRHKLRLLCLEPGCDPEILLLELEVTPGDIYA